MIDLDPVAIETLMADGHSLSAIARDVLKVDRTTILKRCHRDPEIRKAINRGKERHRNRIIAEIEGSETADALEAALWAILREVQTLKRDLLKSNA